MKLTRSLFLFLLLAATVFLGACTPAGISPKKAAEIREKVKSHPLIVSFEGLQPFSGRRAADVTESVAEDLDLAHSATSGNPGAHTKFAKEAAEHGQPVYIVGYSMGCSSAVTLARWCDDHEVPVRVLFLLDPAVLPGKIPDCVDSVVVIESSSTHLSTHVTKKWLEDDKVTSLDVMRIPNSGHGYLPYEAAVVIRTRIATQMH
jgi:hypothetical protein